MKRMIDYHLQSWSQDPYRKPLLLRGARQVGKTHAVRQLGKTFSASVEINLEHFQKEATLIFEGHLSPDRIIRDISGLTGKSIIPGSTLLFIDEIQAVPRAILALRYFYEMMPQLHVVAAGSLLDFAIEQVGVPVGRVQSLYMHPLTFIEFLAAMKKDVLIREILMHADDTELSESLHMNLLELVAEYLALGGMPEVVKKWSEKNDPVLCTSLHKELISFYRQDFGKYARQLQIKYLDSVFDEIPLQMGSKFKFSAIDEGLRKRELAPALELLEKAGIAHKVYYSSGQGVPIGAQIDPQDYKVIFLDVGLAQSMLSLDLIQWFLQPVSELVNKMSLVEAFVGRELVAYDDPHEKPNLCYWRRKERTQLAEVDYIIQNDRQIVPIEVKSGAWSTLKSLQLFLETHAKSPYGIRFSTHNYSVYKKIRSYPLYAVAKVAAVREDVRHSLRYLVD